MKDRLDRRFAVMTLFVSLYVVVFSGFVYADGDSDFGENTPPPVPPFGEPLSIDCVDYTHYDSYRPSFFLKNVDDPDGDPLFYQFVVKDYDDPEIIIYDVTLPENPDYDQTFHTIEVDLEENGHYWVSIRSYDGTDYSDWNTCSIWINLYDEPPGPLEILSPENNHLFPSYVHTVEVRISNPVDPDLVIWDTPVVINFCYSLLSDLSDCPLDESAWHGELSDPSGFTTIELGLANHGQSARGRSYYLAMMGSGDSENKGPKSFLTFHFDDNTPPAAPVINFPTAGPDQPLVVMTVEATCTEDPDHDEISDAWFEISTDSEFQSMLATSQWLPPYDADYALGEFYFNWPLPLQLSFNQEYNLRVKVRDNPSGFAPESSEWATISFKTVENNLPPNAPQFFNPVQDAELGELLYAMVSADDPNGQDIIAVQFQLSKQEDFSSLVSESGWITHLDNYGYYSWHYDPLLFDSQYYLRAKARESYGLAESEWAELSFTTRESNAAPSDPVWVSPPENSGTIFNSYPFELKWTESIDPDGDPVFYCLILSRQQNPAEGEYIEFCTGNNEELDPHVEDGLVGWNFTGTEEPFAENMSMADATIFWGSVSAIDRMGGESGQTIAWLVFDMQDNQNSRPPRIDHVQISPSTPLDSDDLIVEYYISDPDHDPLELTFNWQRFQGSGFAPYQPDGFEPSAVLPASHTNSGDAWTVTLSIDDGTTAVEKQAQAVYIEHLCDDHDPCTDDSLVAKSCMNDPLSDGSPCRILDIHGYCLNANCILSGIPNQECSNADTDCSSYPECANAACDSATLRCTFEPDHDACDDGHACNGEEFCDIDGGCLSTGSNPCDDGIDCTADLCAEGEPAPQCEFAPTDELCNDDNPCTMDSCSALIGCSFEAVNESEDCPSPLPMRQGHCYDGECLGDQCYTDEGCIDLNPCTLDICDIPTGTCSHNPNHDLCDDGDPCNGIEVCEIRIFGGGGCASPDPVICDDGVACTEDSCNTNDGNCVFTPRDFLCNQDFDCSEFQTCDPVQGCLSADAPICSDDVGCTHDVCTLLFNSESSCSYLPFDPICEDQNICTTDLCDPLEDCVHDSNTLECPDDDICNGNEICHGSECIPSAPLKCPDDENSCTITSCDPQSACIYPSKDDWSDCTLNDVNSWACFSGRCELTPPGDHCDEAIELNLGESETFSFEDSHLYLEPVDDCALAYQPRNDLFFSIDLPTSDLGYTVEAAPMPEDSGLNLALIIYEAACPSSLESFCISAIDDYGSGEAESLSGLAGGRRYILQLAISSDPVTHSTFSISILSSDPSDGDGETAADGDRDGDADEVDGDEDQEDGFEDVPGGCDCRSSTQPTALLSWLLLIALLFILRRLRYSERS